MSFARVDGLARALAHTTSRREALRLLLAGGASVVGVALLEPGEARAAPATSARRVVSAAFTCAGADNTASTPCEKLNDYVAQCGVVCPGGERLIGKGGCTVANGSANLAPYATKTVKKSPTKYCSSAPHVTATFSADPKSSVLDWHPSKPACCQPPCDQEVSKTLTALAKHEKGHRTIIDDAVAAATDAWADKSFSACGATAAKAQAKLAAAVTAAYTAKIAALEQQFTQEPPQPPPIDCGVCVPKTPTSNCCQGVCVEGPCATAWCQCNSTCYSSASACTSNCHASLGCFSGICDPSVACRPGATVV